MRIPTADELELKEAKEAIKTLREYCESRGSCDNCDREIKEWCDEYIPPSPANWNLSEWKVET